MAPLFERYHGPLLNFFFRLTGDRESSQDLVQTVFERLLRYRHSFHDNAAFRPWIYKTARNVLYDHRRRTSRLSSVNQEGEADEVENQPDPSWKRRRAARDIHEALDQLPSADRELLVLSRFHGLRYDEIAETMDKSISAIKTQAHRAMHSLRRIYFQEDATHEA